MSEQIQIRKFSPHFKKRWRERVGCITTVQKLNKRIKKQPVYWKVEQDIAGRKYRKVLIKFGSFTVVVQPGSWIAVTVY